MNHLLVGPSAEHPQVYLWSTSRLPFEPTGWLLQLRADLARAIRELETFSPYGIVHAVYASRIGRRCDIENLLVLNVGPGAFGGVASR